MPNVSAGELAVIVRERIAEDRRVSDSAIALEASDRLGLSISPSQISRLRRNLGLNVTALRSQDQSRWHMHLLLSEFRHPTAEEIKLSVLDVPETVAFYVKLGVRGIEHMSGEGSMRIGRFPVRIVSGKEADDAHCFIVYLRDAETYRRFLRSEGIAFLDRNAPSRSGRELVVTDPDGNSVILRTHPNFLPESSSRRLTRDSFSRT